MMEDNANFIILTDSAFPFKKSAANHKYYLLAKALKDSGYNVFIFNKYNVIKNIDTEFGMFKGIAYEFLSGKKRLGGRLNKFKGLIKANYRLFKKLNSSKENNRCNYILFSYSSYPMLLWIKVLAKIFNIKLILNVWEYHQNVMIKPLHRLDAFIFYKHAYQIVDGVISISSFLKKKALEANKKIPVIIIPALADFNQIKKISTNKTQIKENYFLYCGGIGYEETIYLIVNSFEKLNNTGVKLVLVLTGKETLIKDLKKKINNKDVIILNNLSYEDLFVLYKNAIGLLIPLKSEISDIARFPQKVPEYLSSTRPIITNKVGELEKYFVNRINIFFAENYDSVSYAKAMQFLLQFPDKADEIGLSGFRSGREYFHYANIKSDIQAFLDSL